MPQSSPETKGSATAVGDADAVQQHIQEALRGLRYGVVSIIVQDGVVVQVERTEKRRLRDSSARRGA